MKKLSVFLALILTLSLFSCKDRDVETNSGTDAASAAVLSEVKDKGREYIDSFVFLGESTIAHLKSRGVLTGGKATTQVWAPSNGTVNLDNTVSTLRIVYPETNELITVSEAAARKKPKRMLLCFGLNGAVTKIRLGKEHFKNCYLSLINIIRSASPSTEIFLASAFPVAENMDMTNYSITLDELNGYISTINGWTSELASEEGLVYLNIAEPLCDENRRLKTDYQVGDGHHLTAEAYEKVLYYIRTH